INTHVLGSLDDHAALGCFHFDAVNGEFYHVIVLSLQILGHHTLLVLDVVCELVAEMLDKTTHGERSCITQATNRAPDDVAGKPGQHVEAFHATLAVLDPMRHTPYPAGALATGGALAAALVVVEIRQAQQGFDHTAGLVHHDDRPGPQHRAGLGNRVKIHIGLHHDIARHHGRTGTTGDHGF